MLSNNIETNDSLLSFVIKRLTLENCCQDLKESLSIIGGNFVSSGNKCKRNKDRFMKQYGKWLHENLNFSFEVPILLTGRIPTSTVGKPSKLFAVSAKNVGEML